RRRTGVIDRPIGKLRLKHRREALASRHMRTAVIRHGEPLETTCYQRVDRQKRVVTVLSSATMLIHGKNKRFTVAYEIRVTRTQRYVRKIRAQTERRI